MDPINTRLLKQLLRTLEGIERHIKTSLDKNRKSAAEQKQPDTDPTEPELQQVICSIVNLPPAITDYYNAEQQERPRKSRWERLKRVLEIGGLLTAVALALLTYLTLQKIGSQADSAQAQVRIMQRQLEATDRPWIKVVSAEPRSQYSLVEESPGSFRATVDILLRMKNVGRSVANNISVRGELTFSTGQTQVLNEQERICDPRNSFAAALGILTGGWPPISLFPDDDTGQFQIQGTGTMHLGIIEPKLIGCVEYFAAGNTFRHYSSFAYRIEPRKGKPPLFMLEAGSSIKPNDLIMKPESYGFSAQ